MNSDIQELKSRVSLRQVMERLGCGDRCKKSARCPFPGHEDKHPSFSVDEEKSRFTCWSRCGNGDQVTFIERHQGVSRGEAIKLLSEWAGLESKAKAPTASAPKQAAATEPKPAPVKPGPLGDLLDAVGDVLRRYVSFQLPEQPLIIALWIIHTWAFEAAYFSPYLHIYSAETSSGKSRLLEVLTLLVNKPWKLDSGSVATIFRKIDTDKPTVLYDEIDNVFRPGGKDDDTKDLRACLNSGFKWDGKFSRCVGQNANLEVKEFATFSPKALAGIGKVLSDALSNRCIPIELLRRTREEKIERFRERKAQAEHANLKAELEAWAQQPNVIDALKAARPVLPDELTDRQQDITEPMLAIADMAGGEWPDRARIALIKLCSTTGEDVSIGIKLLIDLKRIFDGTDADEIAPTDKLPTIDILNRLVAIEDDRPWAAWWLDDLKHNKPQKPATRLAKLLKPYHAPDGKRIKPRSIKLNDDTVLRGYYREDFTAAWERFLPCPGKAATSATSATYERKTVAASGPVAASEGQGATENAQEGSGSSGSSGSAGGEARGLEAEEPLITWTDVPGLRYPPNPPGWQDSLRPIPGMPSLAELQARLGDEMAHGHLAALLDVLDRDAADGLWPRGHTDCEWGASYPHEYSMAHQCLESGTRDAQKVFWCVNGLVFKIECEAKRGTPLSANGHDWCEGSYPPAFLDSCAYVREQWAKVKQITLAA
jgi:Protein of unknown function (DUF3631)/CHC2 zinc finger